MAILPKEIFGSSFDIVIGSKVLVYKSYWILLWLVKIWQVISENYDSTIKELLFMILLYSDVKNFLNFGLVNIAIKTLFIFLQN